MNILVNGTSVTIGPISWTYRLEDELGCKIANFSRIGCGNKYIHDSTIDEIAQRKYDLVIVSWTYHNRADVRYRAPAAVLCGHELEDKNIINNKNINKHWFFAGMGIGSPADQDTYRAYIRTYDWFWSNEARVEETLRYVISLQSVLKQLNIPYIFTFYRPLIRLKKFQHLYNLIDFNNVHDVHLYHLAKNNNWIIDGHPNVTAHTAYAQTLLAHPNIKNLAKF
jgi:hypothetical protein